MKETSQSDSLNRQLLVRCMIVNTDGDLSHRFVEHNLFNLWQYVMENRHGLQVLRSENCIWLPAREYERQRPYFDNVGEVEAVDRIHIALFDPESGIVHAQQRFTSANDVELATQGLLRQYSHDTRESDDFVFEIDPGFAVMQSQTVYRTAHAPSKSLH